MIHNLGCPRQYAQNISGTKFIMNKNKIIRVKSKKKVVLETKNQKWHIYGDNKRHSNLYYKLKIVVMLSFSFLCYISSLAD
jgi:hypothetical protein